MARMTVRTDGGARGNPGPAAAAYIVEDESAQAVGSGSRCLGDTTNNVAEYQAVIDGLEAALELGASHVLLLADSELVVRQLNGEYKVKHPNIRPLFAKATGLLDRLDGWEAVHVRRDQNAAVDALVNEALDAGSGPSGCLEAPQQTLFP